MFEQATESQATVLFLSRRKRQQTRRVSYNYWETENYENIKDKLYGEVWREEIHFQIVSYSYVNMLNSKVYLECYVGLT